MALSGMPRRQKHVMMGSLKLRAAQLQRDSLPSYARIQGVISRMRAVRCKLYDASNKFRLAIGREAATLLSSRTNP
eukprot:scaffold230701_cov37-Tisochrysis_lutea.AAC.2